MAEKDKKIEKVEEEKESKVEKNTEETNSKQTNLKLIIGLAIIFVVFIILAIFAWNLGTKIADNEDKTNTQEKQEDKKEDKKEPEKVENKPDNENKEPSASEEKELSKNDSLVKEALNLIDYDIYGNGIALNIYNRNEYEFSKLDDKLKMVLALRKLQETKDYPMCSEDENGTVITVDEIKKASPLEDTSFVDKFINSNLKAEGSSTGIEEYGIENKNGKLYVYDNNCDGFGIGIIDMYYTEFESAKKENDKLSMTISFGYFVFDDVDDDNNITYNVYSSYSTSSKKVGRTTISSEEDIDLSKIKDIEFTKYEYTFKIKDDKLYFEKIKIVK